MIQCFTRVPTEFPAWCISVASLCPYLVSLTSSLTFRVSEPSCLNSSTAHVPAPRATPTSRSQKRKSNSSVFGMLHESLSITSNLTGVTFSEDHRYQFCFPQMGSLNGPQCLVVSSVLVYLSQQWKTLGSEKPDPGVSEASHATVEQKDSLWFPHPTGASTPNADLSFEFTPTFYLSNHAAGCGNPSGVLPPLPLAIGMFWESALLSEKPSLSLTLRALAELTRKQRNWTGKIHGGELASDTNALNSGSWASLNKSPVFHLFVFVRTAKGNVLSHGEPASILEASKDCLLPPAWEKVVGDTDGKSTS